ncbi:MAG: DNA topoisomerase IB, partial [Sphingobacteriales bacterium]
YEKLYGSFGLTTLKNKHVNVVGSQIQFAFKGKKAIAHNISIRSKRLAKIVKQCRDIPGKELFQYYDADGNHKCIDSGMVNTYLKTISGHDFTAKDFRTWAGTIHALTAFKDIEPSDAPVDIKKNILKVLDLVAQHLGNTRTVCKKYYVHPILLELYESNDLASYLKLLNKLQKQIKINGLMAEEKLLMLILEKEGLVCM